MGGDPWWAQQQTDRATCMPADAGLPLFANKARNNLDLREAVARASKSDDTPFANTPHSSTRRRRRTRTSDFASDGEEEADPAETEEEELDEAGRLVENCHEMMSLRTRIHDPGWQGTA